MGPTTNLQSPIDSFVESERLANGRDETVCTVLLRGAACPVGCEMCDLHHGLLQEATPIDAIPSQIYHALHPLGSKTAIDAIKLYNGGNFFDTRAVPPSNYDSILDATEDIRRIIVENHPSIGRQHVSSFSKSVFARGKVLEIAVGLESVRPGFLKQIGKGIHRGQVDEYVAWLKQLNIDVRIFLIHGSPYDKDESESIRWTLLSVRHAVSLGVRRISVIPARAVEQWQGWKGRPQRELKLQTLRTVINDDPLAEGLVTVDDPDWGHPPSPGSPRAGTPS